MGVRKALSARAIGGAEVDKLARARSPSAAATPATSAALVGAGEHINTVSIPKKVDRNNTPVLRSPQ
jgi:hypothetical protein